MKLHPSTTDKRAFRRFETLEEDFRKVHDDKYDYSLVEYKRALTKINIICPVHGMFEQTPIRHLKGRACTDCAFERNAKNIRKKYFHLPTMLYYVEITHPKTKESLYKIGITKNDVKTRYVSELRKGYKIETLNIEQFDDGKEAWLKEQLIINSLKEYIYEGDKFLYSGGDSELLVEDVYLY